jgi:hypothetical protein
VLCSPSPSRSNPIYLFIWFCFLFIIIHHPSFVPLLSVLHLTTLFWTV